MNAMRTKQNDLFCKTKQQQKQPKPVNIVAFIHLEEKKREENNWVALVY